jgi:hypothetical protein
MKNGTSQQQTPDILENTRQVTQRLAVAVREALLDHKRAGNPVAVWRDGKVVIVPPEEIVFESDKQSASGNGDNL